MSGYLLGASRGFIAYQIIKSKEENLSNDFNKNIIENMLMLINLLLL